MKADAVSRNAGVTQNTALTPNTIAVYSGTSKTALQVSSRMLATKPEDLSLIPRTYMVEENQLS